MQNNGECGVCGDAYHLKTPRPHEAGGEYAKGTIVRHYTVGQVNDFSFSLIYVLFFLTSNTSLSYCAILLEGYEMSYDGKIKYLARGPLTCCR